MTTSYEIKYKEQLFSFFTLKINICKKHPPRRVPQKTHSRNICNYAKNTVLREKFVMFFRTPVLWNNCEQLLLVLSNLITIFVGNQSEGRISKRVFQENKVHQIFRKTNISHYLIRTRYFPVVFGLNTEITHAYQGVRNVRFLENLASFVFLKHTS